LVNTRPDAEGVKQQAARRLLTFGERVVITLFVGFHSLTLVSPYAIMLVAVGDGLQIHYRVR
jgi:hypothetical protein